MKKWVAISLAVFLLTGCGSDEFDVNMDLENSEENIIIESTTVFETEVINLIPDDYYDEEESELSQTALELKHNLLNLEYLSSHNIIEKMDMNLDYTIGLRYKYNIVYNDMERLIDSNIKLIYSGSSTPRKCELILDGCYRNTETETDIPDIDFSMIIEETEQGCNFFIPRANGACSINYDSFEICAQDMIYATLENFSSLLVESGDVIIDDAEIKEINEENGTRYVSELYDDEYEYKIRMFGDASGVITGSDGKMVYMDNGHDITLEFDASLDEFSNNISCDMIDISDTSSYKMFQDNDDEFEDFITDYFGEKYLDMIDIILRI